MLLSSKCPLFVAPTLKGLATDNFDPRDLDLLAEQMAVNPTIEWNALLAMAAVKLWKDACIHGECSTISGRELFFSYLALTM